MNYDIKLINNYEGKGRIELARMEFLAKHVKSIAQKALLLQLYGYSKVSLPNKLIKYLNIFLTQTHGNDGETILTLDAENFQNIPVCSESSQQPRRGWPHNRCHLLINKLIKYLNIFLTQTHGNDGETILTLDAENFQNIPVQLDLFREKKALDTLTPMALVIKSFTAALREDEDKNLIDEPLIDELIRFKKFFTTDTEKILLTNRSTIPAIEFSRKEIDKIESLYKSIPSPQKTVVAGVIDEMKFSREQVILTTADHKKIVVVVAKDLFQELKEYFGQEIAITGLAHF